MKRTILTVFAIVSCREGCGHDSCLDESFDRAFGNNFDCNFVNSKKTVIFGPLKVQPAGCFGL